MTRFTPGLTSGAQLYRAIADRADELGRPLKEFVRPLNSNTAEFLRLIQRSKTPTSLTIERVEALIDGIEIPAPQKKRRSAATALADPRPIGPVPDPVDRDPCFRCEVPRDRHAEHGCRKWTPRP